MQKIPSIINCNKKKKKKWSVFLKNTNLYNMKQERFKLFQKFLFAAYAI